MKILWICFVWPEPTSSAAGVRTVELINNLLEAGHHVQVCSPCQSNAFMEKLILGGVACECIQANDSKFDEYLKQYQPEIVFFDRFVIEEQFSWRVKEHCPDALRILDTIDLHSLRRARHNRVKDGHSATELLQSDLQSEDAIREIASIYRCDLSLMISDFETKFLQEIYNIPKEVLHLCRLSYAAPKLTSDFSARQHFVTIGNFNHAPNLDSFKFLHDSLWAKIKSALKEQGVEDAELHIYGAYPKKELLELDNEKTGFRVKGWTEDAMLTLSRYRVSFAALRFGAGIKGKISDGWAVGTPCVATSIAAEGMHEGYEFGGVISDDWTDFAKEAASLYAQKEGWEIAQQRGIEIIQELYNPERNASDFLNAVESAFNKREELRSKNFISKILWHNQFRSSEYFSRWIEEKNRRG